MHVRKLLNYFINNFCLQIFRRFFLAIYLRIKTCIYIIANAEEKPLEQTVNHAQFSLKKATPQGATRVQEISLICKFVRNTVSQIQAMTYEWF